jgi:hypothetical protein
MIAVFAPSGGEEDRLRAQPHEFSRGAAAWATHAIRQLMMDGHPLYASVTHEPIYDDSDVDRGAQSGETVPAVRQNDDPLGYRELPAQIEWIITYDEVLAFDRDAVLAMLNDAANAFAGQIEAGMLAHISDITEATGNVVSVSGRDFAEAVLDSLERMEFSFDADGEPNLTFVMHPDQARRLQGAEFTPEQQARHDAIIARKREEWNASQRRRELPGISN